MIVLFFNMQYFPAPHFVTTRSAVLELLHADGWTGTRGEADTLSLFAADSNNE
jgi:hypothetical protein